MKFTSLQNTLEESAQKYPDKTLLFHRGQSQTYGQTEAASNTLAATLQNLGVVKGDRVALVLDNIPEYPIAYYAILKIGAAVVPLCADTRIGSLSRALSHAEAKAIIVGSNNSALLANCHKTLPALRAVVVVGSPKLDPPKGVQVLEIANILEENDSFCRSVSTLDDLASLMYTSGTTAEPKGVMLSHRNLLANTFSIITYLRLQPKERVGLVLPFFYSYGTSVLLTHVAVGGTIVSLGSMAFPAAVLQGLQDYQCTGFPGVPSTFARLLHFGAFDQYDLTVLEYITQAGGPMTPALTEKLQKALPHVRIFVMYGQTEAGPRLSYLPPE
ncbi:MAG: class I adenylate-forming enzyme family protein, partial [Pseudomonadota bacterium]